MALVGKLLMILSYFKIETFSKLNNFVDLYRKELSKSVVMNFSIMHVFKNQILIYINVYILHTHLYNVCIYICVCVQYRFLFNIYRCIINVMAMMNILVLQ